MKKICLFILIGVLGGCQLISPKGDEYQLTTTKEDEPQLTTTEENEAQFTSIEEGEVQPIEEVKFKNPLFYKKMINLSSHYFWDIQLTPTTMTSYLRHTDTVWVQKCNLIKNEDTYVIMSCQHIEKPHIRNRIKCVIDDTSYGYIHVACHGSDDKYDDPEEHRDSLDNYTFQD